MRGAINRQAGQATRYVEIMMHHFARLRAVAVFGRIAHVSNAVERVKNVVSHKWIQGTAGQRQSLAADSTLRIVAITFCTYSCGGDAVELRYIEQLRAGRLGAILVGHGCSGEDRVRRVTKAARVPGDGLQAIKRIAVVVVNSLYATRVRTRGEIRALVVGKHIAPRSAACLIHAGIVERRVLLSQLL